MSNNIYAKLATARAEFHSMELVKTGRNKFANYSYFELGDFLIPALNCLSKQQLVPLVSFDAETATMMVYDAEGDGVIVITSPMIKARYEYLKDDGDTKLIVEQGAGLKGCHPVQNLGAVETYQRRYLWVALMEIVEHDALDAAPPVDAKPTQVDKSVEKPAPTKPAEQHTIENAKGAQETTDMLIQFAEKMHSGSMQALSEFWTSNKKLIDLLDRDWPYEYTRLKEKFTEIKNRLQE